MSFYSDWPGRNCWKFELAEECHHQQDLGVYRDDLVINSSFSPILSRQFVIW